MKGSPVRFFGRRTARIHDAPTAGEADAAIELTAARRQLADVRRQGAEVQRLVDSVRRAASQVVRPGA